MSVADPMAQLEAKTQRYVRKMPYLKALIISELQNDIEIYRYINLEEMKFSNTNINENFLNGLRGGMNELFTDFKKQFEKLEACKVDASKQGGDMDFDDNSGNKKSSSENYSVGVMYDKYYVRKKEIAKDVLMIAICDTEMDSAGSTTSTFNIGQIDILFYDFQNNFKEIESKIEEISTKLA